MSAMGEHVRLGMTAAQQDQGLKKLMSVFKSLLPQLDDKLLRFLNKNRTGLTAESLAAKLGRDFKVIELDAMCAAHLPWRPQALGSKAAKAAELGAWILDNRQDYLDQQGAHLTARTRRERRRYWMGNFW